MRAKRILVRGLAALFVIEIGLVASYAMAATPLPVPVDGISHAAVPQDFHAPRPGFHSAHQGTDLLARRGTPVRSVGWGVVAGIEEQPRGGKVVFVAGEGAMLFFYAHLDRWAPELHLGQVVAQGTLLGYVGDTGNARGIPHLHFEARPAATAFAPIDPQLVIGARPAPFGRRLQALATSLPEHR
jgi:peptidoglycan LD-endopeptidase LytH